MGVSTDGIIGFGIPFEEGTEFPWDAEEFDGDIETWWRSVNGYVAPYEPWTPEGEYAEGWSSGDPRLTEYFDHRREWMTQHPVPVKDVNYCSGDYPMYALCVPISVIECSRGTPATFDPKTLHITEAATKELLEFCRKYEIEIDTEPAWLLMSYWG